MVCPVCKIEAKIVKTVKQVNIAEQKAYRIQTYSCQNKNCKNFGQEIGQKKTEDPAVVFT